MKRWAAAIALLTVALIASASAQPPRGEKPKPQESNKDAPPPGKKPPPLKSNKSPGDSKDGAPAIGKNGTKADGFYTLSAGGFNIEVNGAKQGQPPYFRFWSDPNNMQKIEFGRMFQTRTPNNITGSKPMKMVNIWRSYRWTLGDTSSEVDTATNTTDMSFTVTGTAKNGVDANRPTPGLQLSCHLLSSANGTEFKYDIKISDFDDSWWNESATALVLGYRISTMEPDGTKEKGNLTLSDVRIQLDAKRPVRPKKSDGTNGGVKPRAAMDFGNGNGMEIVSTATEDGGAEKMVLMTAIADKQEGSFVLTIYERFSKGITHDPTLFGAGTSSTITDWDIVLGDSANVECLVDCSETEENKPILDGGASSIAASGLCSFIVLSALAMVSSF